MLSLGQTPGEPVILKGNQAVVAGQLGVSADTLLVLLNSGATGNFIDQDYVSSQRLETTRYASPQQLTLFNGSPTSLGPIEEYVEEDIVVAGVKGKAKFGVTRLSRVSLVLGYPWLKEQRVVLDSGRSTITSSK